MAFSEIPSYSTSTPVITSGGGMPYGGYGGGFGGTALAAGAGALLGGLFLNGGLGGAGVAKDVVVEKSIGDLGAAIPAQTVALQHDLLTGQLSDACRTYDQTIAFGQYANSIDKDIFQTSYGTSRQMCDGFNTSNVIALENKYDNALQICKLEHDMDKCCCETNQNILKMGYETQLRDACYKNDTDKQLCEIKCLIKDTEKDAVIRGLQNKVYDMSQCVQTKAITDCIKDSFCKTSSALNQIGINEQIINPSCFWPPFVPSNCCC